MDVEAVVMCSSDHDEGYVCAEERGVCNKVPGSTAANVNDES
jgi:hypothetical protein